MRVLFTETDSRVIAALPSLAREGVHVSLLDQAGPARQLAQQLDVSLRGVDLIDTIPDRGALANNLARKRGSELWLAEKLLERPVYAGLAMLAANRVDAVVAGVTSHTADVLVACEMCLGFAPGTTVASGAFVIDTHERGTLIFADCAVNPDPTAEQLARIAITTAQTAADLLCADPRVAMLSFSTHGSAHHPRVAKVAQATELARALKPDLAIEGEIQADVALDPIAAAYKSGPDPEMVAGVANVLVFPDLDSGNIAYKLVRTLARANAYGALLQGYARPVAKLSRGVTSAEIVGTVRLMMRQRTGVLAA
ncbi:MAG: phosphate acyltransferase [Kofleriaceae bacterium]